MGGAGGLGGEGGHGGGGSGGGGTGGRGADGGGGEGATSDGDSRRRAAPAQEEDMGAVTRGGGSISA